MNPIPLLRRTWQDFNDNHGPMLAAGLAYYSLFAVFPLVIAVIAVLAFLLEQGVPLAVNAQAAVLDRVRENAPGAAEVLAQSLRQIRRERTLLSLWSLTLFIISGSAIFGHLEYTLGVIFDSRPRKRNFSQMVLARLVNASMVFVATFLLLASIVLDTALEFVRANLTTFPGSDLLWSGVNPVLSVATTALLFALLFKIIPQSKPGLREVASGALVGAVLWEVGKQVLAWYVGRQSYRTVYGPMAGAIIMLVWLYYSAHILLISAQLAATYTRLRRSLSS